MNYTNKIHFCYFAYKNSLMTLLSPFEDHQTQTLSISDKINETFPWRSKIVKDKQSNLKRGEINFHGLSPPKRPIKVVQLHIYQGT